MVVDVNIYDWEIILITVNLFHEQVYMISRT